MKKLLFLFLPLALLFASCSDDDDDDFKHPIVGTWQFTYFEFEVDAYPEALKKDIEFELNQMMEESMDDEDWAETSIFIFKGNKKVDISDGSEIVKNAFSFNILEEDILTMKSLFGISLTLTYQFEIAGKELILATDVSNEDRIQELKGHYPNGQIHKVLVKEVMTRK